jgi:hypothetical protein
MNLHIIFNAPSLTRNEYFSIMKSINENLKALTEQFGDMENAEIKLYDTMEDNTHNDKAALISIKFENENFIEYRVAGKWDELIIDVFQSLTGESIIKNPDLHLVY